MYGKSAWPQQVQPVECKNKDHTLDLTQCIKLALISVYKLDKVIFLKHITARESVIRVKKLNL